MTLDQALAEALESSPHLAESRAEVAEAEGRLRQARTWPHNPEVEGMATRRSLGAESGWDWEVGLSQEVELGGQTARRAEVAKAEREAVAARARRTARRVAAEVHLHFTDAVEARELLSLARAEADLAADLHALAQRRLAAGASTLLDLNVAAAELGRAEHAQAEAEAAYAAARARLAETMGRDPAILPEPEGGMPVLPGEVPQPAALMAAAEAGRADLSALRAEVAAADARLALARSERWPGLRVGAFVGREEQERVAGVGLSVPLPIFDRNQGAVEAARAGVGRAEASLGAARLSLAREVVVAYERHRALEDALAQIESRVLGTTERNLELLRRSFEAGKASWLEVLFMRQSLFEARRGLVTTRAERHRSRVALELAAGRMPLPSPAQGADR